MANNTPRSIFFSIVGILLAGGCGGLAGWTVVSLLGVTGVAAALVAAVTAMFVATGVWVALTVALDKAGLLR
ncbi:MAG: hypothetical protein ABIO63_05520 [Casimicrobiaceae bacterium]